MTRLDYSCFLGWYHKTYLTPKRIAKFESGGYAKKEIDECTNLFIEKLLTKPKKSKFVDRSKRARISLTH